MKLAEYLEHDAIGLAKLIAGGQVSSTEVHDAVRAATNAIDPQLRAVVHQFEQPVQAPSMHAKTSPLAGFPMLLKDMLDVEGTPMTLGTRLGTGYRCVYTHPIAERMLQSGISFVGRTNMSELGLLPTTEPTLFGPTHNPWNRDHSPGGSSGGAAAAVASGMVPMAYAADGGGSVRIPASCCGLFGLKPSGALNPMHPRDEPFRFIVHNPVSRTVRDTAALMDITAATRPDASFLQAIERPPRALRIGLIDTRFDGTPIHPTCVAAVHSAAKQLESLGHQVEAVRLPTEAHQLDHALRIFWVMSAGYFFKEVRTHLLGMVPAQAAKLIPRVRLLRRALSIEVPMIGGVVEPFTAAVGRLDRFHEPSDVWLVCSQIREAQAALNIFFENIDVVLSPTLGEPPWKIGRFNQRSTPDAAEAALSSYVPFTPLANLTGLPAMNLPLYWHDSLPIGVQCMANDNQDGLLLQLAAQVEKAFPWADRRPDIHLSKHT